MPEIGSPRSPKDITSNENSDLAGGPSPWNGEAWGTLRQYCNTNGDKAYRGAEAYGESGAVDDGETQPLADQGLAAAKRGHDWLSAFWAELTPDERRAVGGQDALARWKIIAARAG